ncbi:carbamoyltransferase (plasmid) [Azospirillum melinis]|uniref:carbamoyltransferase family protein n=1 Tax=Azospirillum melinis TaxID=328839 RepID=UPI0037574E3E
MKTIERHRQPIVDLCGMLFPTEWVRLAEMLWTAEMSRYLLGLSFDYHDAAAALLKNGEVVAAAQEERFSRVKHSPSLPEKAIAFCLETAGISKQDLDAIAFYERPLLKLDRVLTSNPLEDEAGKARFVEVVARWLVKGHFSVHERLAAIGLPADRLHFIGHHQSHAASAFFCSPFEEALVITLDGVGEHETVTISIGRGTSLTKLRTVNFPSSLGLFYSAFTAFLGFEVNEGEYKVMGMAGFGEPCHAQKLLDLFDLHEDGTFSLDQSLFLFRNLEATPFSQGLIDLFGPPREPDAPFAPSSGGSGGDEQSRHYADIAASVQRCAEDVILHIVGSAMRETRMRNVCLAGGVALNSVANNRLQTELGCRLFVQPAAGDAGGALGAALQVHHQSGGSRSPAFVDPYLGASFGEEEILEAIDRSGLDAADHDDPDAMIEAVADHLARGCVVGWFQGRAEWGPRALGCRSILASPLGADMQLRVNEKIKFREPFRPFAPSVLQERASEFFDLPATALPLSGPEHFMISVCPVRQEMRDRIPAVTHVDGTARVHLVSERANPRFYRLINAFGQRTGTPVLLNTSFNLRGEAIVNSPADAMATFLASGIDYLVLGTHVVRKFGMPE